MTKLFRYETELAAPAEAYFAERLGSGHFAHELEALRTAPDLVAGCPTSAYARRLARGPEPVTTALELRLLEFAHVGVSDAALREWAPWGWRDLKRRALEPALARGLIRFDDERWTAVVLPPAYARLVAIELKLGDWRKGVRQARRNLVFATQSWLVMPAPVPDEALELARWVGVGVVALDGEAVELVAAREQRPLSGLAARLYGELLLAQTLARMSGVTIPLAGSPRGRVVLATAPA